METKVKLSVEDKKLREQIDGLHCTAKQIEVISVENLINFADATLKYAIDSSDAKESNDIKEVSKYPAVELARQIIHKIGCMISCNVGDIGKLDDTTLAVFKELRSYSWEAKVAITISAFAVSYGELYLTSKSETSELPLAKLVRSAKALQPNIIKAGTRTDRLLKRTIEIAKTMIEITKLDSKFLPRDKPPLSVAMKHYSKAALFVVKAVVLCATQTIGLIDDQHERATKEVTFLEERLEDMLKYVNIKLTEQYEQCLQEIRDLEYPKFKEQISARIDIIEVLRDIICSDNDKPLFYRDKKSRDVMVSLEELRGKQAVMLFISEVDILDEVIEYLLVKGKPYCGNYALVWLPITAMSMRKKSEEVNKRLQEVIIKKAEKMKEEWYSLHYSLSLQDVVIRYIKEEWHYKYEPLLVVLDARGKMMHPNAFHLFMTWGSEAFPFSKEKLTKLKAKLEWNIKFLIGDIDLHVDGWIHDKNIICLYGGEETDSWLTDLTTEMKRMGIFREGINSMELIYVGKKHNVAVKSESYKWIWEKSTFLKFKARLENIFFASMELGLSIENNQLLKDVMLLLSFANEGGQGWTIIAQGSDKMFIASQEIIMGWLNSNKGSYNINRENFFSSLKAWVEEQMSVLKEKHCINLTLPRTTGIVRQDKMSCFYCNRPMKKCVTYSCCL